jgi:hypothetical protein
MFFDDKKHGLTQYPFQKPLFLRRFRGNFLKGLDCLIDTGIVYVAMYDEAELAWFPLYCEDPLVPELLGRFLLLGADKQDIGIDWFVQSESGDRLDRRGEPLCSFMIFCKDTGFEVVESDEAGGGEDTDLAHAAAQCLTYAACLGNQFVGPYKEGSSGGTEALGQADGEGVDMGGGLMGRLAGCDQGVPQSGAVHMDW